MRGMGYVRIRSFRFVLIWEDRVLLFVFFFSDPYRDKKALEEKISKKAGQGTSSEGNNATNNSKSAGKK